MAANNLILLALLDDNIIERNIIEYLVEDVVQDQLLNNFDVRRGVRKKNEDYYERIVPLYNNDLFKEHFRMSRAAVEVSLM